MNGDLNAFKEKLGLSPKQTVDREQAIVRSEADREQAKVNIKQKDAEEMQQARKELGLPPVEGFNPDRPIEEGIQDASDKYEAKRFTERAKNTPSESSTALERQIRAKNKKLKLEIGSGKPEGKTYSPEDDAAWNSAMEDVGQDVRARNGSLQGPALTPENSGINLVGASDRGKSLDAEDVKQRESANAAARAEKSAAHIQRKKDRQAKTEAELNDGYDAAVKEQSAWSAAMEEVRARSESLQAPALTPENSGINLVDVNDQGRSLDANKIGTEISLHKDFTASSETGTSSESASKAEKYKFKLNPESSDLYERLGLSKDASKEDVAAAYREAAMFSHPDKNPGNEKIATERFKSFQEAFDTLNNPDRRAQYDFSLNSEKHADKTDDSRSESVNPNNTTTEDEMAKQKASEAEDIKQTQADKDQKEMDERFSRFESD